VVARERDVFDAPHHRGEEGVLDVGDQHGPERGALPAQGPGRAERLVAQGLGGPTDAVGAVGRHVRRAVQHA
jgi:hypothetical protein